VKIGTALIVVTNEMLFAKKWLIKFYYKIGLKVERGAPKEIFTKSHKKNVRCNSIKENKKKMWRE
jgi:ABC-type histidine transport system ATPase subunit